MKRQGNLFQKVYDIDNIKLAICMAAKGKKSRRGVQEILDDLDFYAVRLQEMLMNKSFEPKSNRTKELYCVSSKKTRIVVVPEFYPDLCIQWALMLQLEPIIQKGMYYYSCGSLPNRGVHFEKSMCRSGSEMTSATQSIACSLTSRNSLTALIAGI